MSLGLARNALEQSYRCFILTFGFRVMSAALQVLQTTFGFSHFREPQQAIVEAIIAGDDAFVLMPTGGAN